MLCSCSIGLNRAPAEPPGPELVAMIVSAAAAAAEFAEVVAFFYHRFTKADKIASLIRAERVFNDAKLLLFQASGMADHTNV